MYEQYYLKERDGLQQLKDALLTGYFSDHDQEFLTSEAGREDIRANVHKRYENALEHVVPWVSAQAGLQGKKLVEIGCGTGSSTAAFAHFVDRIDCNDINPGAITAARVRLEIMGLDNVALHLVTAENLVAILEENHPERVDIILLFAVLEHQTIQERHETLLLCWNLLRDDGLLVVSETLNLLHYTDLHTSSLPFLHSCPRNCMRAMRTTRNGRISRRIFQTGRPFPPETWTPGSAAGAGESVTMILNWHWARIMAVILWPTVLKRRCSAGLRSLWKRNCSAIILQKKSWLCRWPSVELS